MRAPRLSLRKKIAFGAGTALLGLGILEISLRGLFEFRSVRYIHPFLGVSHKPHLERAKRTYDGRPFTWATNNYGARGPDIVGPKEPGEIRVFTIGGSTTEDALLPGEETWSGVLSRDLNANLRGRRVHVYNFGIGGGSSSRTLMTTALLILPRLQPDCIVVYHGNNDITYGSFADYDHPLGDIGRGEPYIFFRRSAILRFFLGHLPSRHAAFRSDVEMIEQVPAAGIDDLLSNTRSLVGACMAHRVPVVLGPEAFHAGAYPVRGDRQGFYLMNGKKLGRESYVENMRLVARRFEALAAEFDDAVTFVDIQSLCQGPENFQDGDYIHLTREGTRIVGTAFAKAILERGILEGDRVTGGATGPCSASGPPCAAGRSG